MKIEREFIIPYSVAIGVFNLIFTGVIVLILSWIFDFSLTRKIFWEHYAVGYVVLWILNLKIIRE